MDFLQLELEMKELDRQVAEWKVLLTMITYFYVVLCKGNFYRNIYEFYHKSRIE